MQLKAAYLPDWEESKTCLHVGVMEDSKEIWTAIIALLSSMILILWYQQSWVCWRQAWWLVNYCQAPGPVLVQCPGLVQCPDWIQGPNKGEDSGQTLHSKFKVIISKARTWSDTIIKLFWAVLLDISPIYQLPKTWYGLNWPLIQLNYSGGGFLDLIKN